MIDVENGCFCGCKVHSDSALGMDANMAESFVAMHTVIIECSSAQVADSAHTPPWKMNFSARKIEFFVAYPYLCLCQKSCVLAIYQAQ